MGDPATPTPADRAATRELAAKIVEAVRNDEVIPEDVVDATLLRDDTDRFVFMFAQEIESLRRERDEAWRIVRSAAHLAKAYIEVVISDLNDDEEQDNDLGQAQVWIDQANERIKP